MKKKILLGIILLSVALTVPMVTARKPLRIFARYSKQIVVIDGNLDLDTEYAHADSYIFETREGYVTFYIQHNAEKMFLGMDIDDTDVFPSWNDQIFIGFDLNHDLQYLDDINDFFILWHGHPHGDPEMGSGPWIGTGVGYGNIPIPDVEHAHQVRQEGYRIEFSIPMSRFPQKLVGFHIRHSPYTNQNYVWEQTGNVQGIIDDYDASKYGDLRFNAFGHN